MATLLVLVAVLPLIGMVAATWMSIRDARSVMQAANDADQLSDRAVAGTAIASTLFDEMSWTVVDVAPQSLGLPPGLIAGFLDADAEAGLVEARARLDELLVDPGWSGLRNEVAELRATDLDVESALVGYRVLIDEAEGATAAALRQLVVTPRGSDQHELAQATSALLIALQARAAVSAQFFGFFATRWDVRDAPAVELARLHEAHRVYERSIAELSEIPSLGDALAVLEANESVQALDGAVERLIDESLAEGLPERGDALTLENVLPEVAELAPMFEAGVQASEASSALIDLGSSGVVEAVDAVDRDARARILQVSLLAVFLTAGTIAMGLVAGRFIIRPLRELRRTADSLRTGQPAAITPVGGPMEIRAAALALGEAEAHFGLLTRQAQALATGDLGSDVLGGSAPSGLGEALQQAVGRLRRSLAQQEEFRRRLAHEAAHDGLTNLANRSASLAQLTRSLARTGRAGTRLAVLFVDLDHFKDVNDLHGHHAGDTVLALVAQRLVTVVREGDHVGRLGGDEFLVVAEPIADVDAAVGLADRVIEALSEPFEIADGHVRIGASIGIAITDEQELTADELLRDADLAVYRVKHAGRGGVEVCNDALREELARTADLSLAIRQAIADDDFVLHYQPIVNTLTGRYEALEALIRWRRADDGELVPPDEFILFAERSNLIVEIDRWVIEHVARQLAAWQNEGRWAGTRVAINISGRHLGHDRFVDHVLEPLTRHGVSPTAVILEVTESALLEDLGTAAQKFARLREAGAQVSIDDFGTGYTSLAHLRALPVDNLKIDRSFTSRALTDPNEASIVKLIIDTGHLLGVTITAEGVETELEVDKFTALGSDTLQGYHLARPSLPNGIDGPGGAVQPAPSDPAPSASGRAG